MRHAMNLIWICPVIPLIYAFHVGSSLTSLLVPFSRISITRLTCSCGQISSRVLTESIHSLLALLMKAGQFALMSLFFLVLKTDQQIRETIILANHFFKP